MGRYEELYRRSQDDATGFWLDAARGIDWAQPPTTALDNSRAPIFRWFPTAG